MSTKALWALIIAVVLPVVSYWIVDTYSKTSVPMPPRYYADTVVEKVVRGKKVIDTQWHRVQNIPFTNQLGKQVSFDDLQDKVLVVDFFFTRCPSICPAMTRNMKKLQELMRSKDPRRVIDTPLAHLVSISIDPERDSVSVLKRYADNYGVDHDRWWLLTGDKKAIYDFAIRELKLGVMDGNGVDTLFDHSPRMVLLDKQRVVRGYYNGLDTSQILKLSQDLIFLSLEKDRSKPSALFRQLADLWPIFLIVVLAVGLLFYSAYRNQIKINQ